MMIEPTTCLNCGRKAHPGELGFQVSMDSSGVKIICDCGNIIDLSTSQEQFILSSNSFIRLRAASNHSEIGEVGILPGVATEIKFNQVFDFPCKAYITPQTSTYLLVKETNLRCDGMTLVSSYIGEQPSYGSEVKVSWLVFGLINIDDLQPWYIHFYSALTHLENGFFKAALLDYAIAFEIFLETYLMERFKSRYNEQIGQYILKRSWRVEERCKDILELATNHSLLENKGLYDLWVTYVRDPRNKLAHGKRITIDREQAEKAHQIVYQAINWIENLLSD